MSCIIMANKCKQVQLWMVELFHHKFISASFSIVLKEIEYLLTEGDEPARTLSTLQLELKGKE